MRPPLQRLAVPRPTWAHTASRRRLMASSPGATQSSRASGSSSWESAGWCSPRLRSAPSRDFWSCATRFGCHRSASPRGTGLTARRGLRGRRWPAARSSPTNWRRRHRGRRRLPRRLRRRLLLHRCRRLRRHRRRRRRHPSCHPHRPRRLHASRCHRSHRPVAQPRPRMRACSPAVCAAMRRMRQQVVVVRAARPRLAVAARAAASASDCSSWLSRAPSRSCSSAG